MLLLKILVKNITLHIDGWFVVKESSTMLWQIWLSRATDCRIIIVKNVKWLIFPWCISVKWCQNSDLLNTYVFIVHYCLELVNKQCIFPQILYFLMIHFESYHPESELSTISAEITKISVYMATKKWLSSTPMVNWLLYWSFTFLIMRDTSLFW